MNPSFITYQLNSSKEFPGSQKNPMLIKRAIISFLDIDNEQMTKSKRFYSEKFLRFSHEEKI